MKIGIFIVAYNAEKTIQSVLSRIPERVWNKIESVVIFDDSSVDDTVKQSVSYQGYGNQKIKIFHNSINLGYGGNQKRGYKYFIENDYDLVVLLHGDGQYAPECLEILMQPILEGEADAVFGSRMLVKGEALRGGMPLYKLLGNKILSTVQNKLLGTEFSEFHSGYRAYKVDRLARLPFLENTNDFHFDTQIIIQLLEDQSRIKEIPIPVYYGDEICHVNGIKYAFDVVIATLKYRLFKAGAFIEAKEFDIKTKGEKYNFKYNKFSSHQQIISLVKEFDTDISILDVGCGSGLLASKLSELGYTVVGIDLYDNEMARSNCSEFYIRNLDQGLGLAERYLKSFDLIMFADVLEHLREPEKLLLESRSYLKDKGQVIATTGNVAHIYIRAMLFLGFFQYADKGILDRTHTRLFTRKTFKKCLSESGYKLMLERFTPIPFENLVGKKSIADFLSWFNNLFVKLRPQLFAFQFIVKANLDKAPTGSLIRTQQLNDEYTEIKKS